MRVFWVGLALVAGFFVAAPAAVTSASAQQFADRPGLFGIFDEVRLGGSTSIQSSDDSTAIVRGEVLFKRFGGTYDEYLQYTFLRPRAHFGVNVATGGDDRVSQVFGGLTWDFPIFSTPFYVQASFGGQLHDGPLDEIGFRLGCRLLFRESIGVGVALGEHWNVLAALDHSSHAGLCGDNTGNAGLTHAGAYVGYRF